MLFCSHSAALFISGLHSCLWIKKHRAAAAAVSAAAAAAAAAPLNQLIGQKVMRHRYAAVPETNYSRRLQGRNQDQGSGPSSELLGKGISSNNSWPSGAMVTNGILLRNLEKSVG